MLVAAAVVEELTQFRKHLGALEDVAAAGGRKDTATLLTCYQQPDTETLLAMMSEERKVRDVALAK